MRSYHVQTSPRSSSFFSIRCFDIYVINNYAVLYHIHPLPQLSCFKQFCKKNSYSAVIEIFVVKNLVILRYFFPKIDFFPKIWLFYFFYQLFCVFFSELWIFILFYQSSCVFFKSCTHNWEDGVICTQKIFSAKSKFGSTVIVS